MILRPYQNEIVDSIFGEFATVQSTLISVATGCGKTQCFTEVVRRLQPKRSLILAHRSELIDQARHRIEQAGMNCEVEMADQFASLHGFNRTDAVVATVQSLVSGNGVKRMERFAPTDFGLVVVDEAHHSTAGTYVKVLEYFKRNPELKILGVTATPDRADEEALGKIFETVAFEYELPQAVDDGWLVHPHQQFVEIQSLDYSECRTTAGDLNGGDLARVMEEESNLQGIADATLKVCGNRRTIVFTVSVVQAEQLSNIFNRHRSCSSSWVCGATPKDERKAMIQQFDLGRTQIMVNVGCLTEGFDSPLIECVVVARPTKSRALYAQMIGRGTRTAPGVVDGLETPEERKNAIAASLKPFVTVLDFSGNSGRHKLVSTADILGGKYSEEVIAMAKKKSKTEDRPMADLLAESEDDARKEAEKKKLAEEERRRSIIGRAQFKVTSINPFDVFDLKAEPERGWDRELSPAQKGVLVKAGLDTTGLTYHQQKQLLNEQFRRWNNGLCSYKQAKLLQRYGYDTKNMTMSSAREIIDELAANGWKRVE